MKLYISSQHPGQWIAWTPDTGWVRFPAAVCGWDERKPCRGLDPVHLRQVPARLALTSGVPAQSVAPAEAGVTLSRAA